MEQDCPWEIETIDAESFLLRHIAANKRITVRERKFPGPDHFALREDLGEDSLSLNWSKYADVGTCYKVIGLTIGRNDEFIDYTGYVVFKYPVSFLKSLSKFEKIKHEPNWYGNPSPEGNPNNRAHSLLYCGTFDNGTRSMLSLYCQDEVDAGFKFKVKTVREEIEALKIRKNDTPFHKDWNFDN